MDHRIEPGYLSGEVRVPPSKSMSHRAVIAAALAEGRSMVDNLVYSEDIEATCDAVSSFGCSVRRLPAGAEIDGRNPLLPPATPIRCRESGSTLRFLIPFACLTDGETVFNGEGELVKRPLAPYITLFDEQGIRYRYAGALPLTVSGRLKPAAFELPGNVSSQFITGLLFVLPLLSGDSSILPTTPLESVDYVNLTLQVMRDFGVSAEIGADGRYIVPGNQRYHPTRYRVEGDFSQAAFWIAAGLMGDGLTLLDLRKDTLQGDKRILDIVSAMGGSWGWEGDKLRVSGSKTRGALVDASQCPDIVPIVATLAAVSEGTTRIVNAGRLRIKESDRLRAMTVELNKLGAKVTEEAEGLTIEGVERLSGGIVNGWNDHRIVMSLAIAAIKCDAPVVIEGSEAVKKSYPRFFQDFRALGGAVR